MRRESAEVTAATRRRLELLARDLGQPDGTVVVPDPGRHSRPGRAPSWHERLPITLRPAHLGLVALVVAAGLAVSAWSVLSSAPSASPVPMAHTTTPSARATPAAPTASSSVVGTDVVIDVAGKVRHPGVMSLPAGSRVVDAIKRAGGALAKVDLSSLNLARKLVDGEQILVGQPATAGGAAAPGAAAPSAGATVNLNTATLDALEGLPGVGPVTAEKILAWRTENGAFTSVDELLEVDGIGEKTMAEIAPHVTV
jgi:competence protein ComEA